MFKRFRATYANRRDAVEAGVTWPHKRLIGVDGYASFAAEFAGASFDAGLYRVHDGRTGPQALALIADAFPEFAQRVSPFGYDWLGRQFAVDSSRVVGGHPQVLLLEPGTGEALEIPFSFSVFHDGELIDHPDAAVASEFFRTWSDSNADTLPLLRHQCVGYKVPLFLGGKDAVENLEVRDVDIYWSICSQTRR